MPVSTYLLWMLLIWGLGWCAWPLSHRIWNHVELTRRGVDWPDGGIAAGRVTLLALWSLGVFWAGHYGLAVRHGWVLLWPLLATCAWLGWRDRELLQATFRQKQRAIWWNESTFVAIFLFFFLLRGFWPDISNGEKPMDMALISACARADSLPPANPYLAGSRLGGYYYLGHLQTALLTTTIQAEPRWTYNLMCATLPALCFSILWPFCSVLCGHLSRGALASALVLTLGTLEPLRQWFRPISGEAAWPFGPLRINYFATSRVIPNPARPGGGFNPTINEYPWFTFQYADLHAHYFAMPLALLMLSLATALFFRGDAEPLWLLLGGVLLAVLLMTNSWDAPVYFVFLALCLWAGARTRVTGANTTEVATSIEATASAATSTAVWPRSWRLAIWFLSLAVVGATMLLAAQPFLSRLHTNAFPPAPLDQPASPLRSWLLMWGIFVTAWSLTLMLPGLRRAREQSTFPRGLLWLALPLATWLLLLLAPSREWVWHWPRPLPNGLDIAFRSGADYSVLAILLTLQVATFVQLLRAREARHIVLCSLAFCGLLVLLWSEVTWAGFIARKLDEPTFHRQDTVFKFGLQAWYLLGIAATCGALRARPGVSHNGPVEARLFHGWPLGLLLAFSVLLPVAWVSSFVTMGARARLFTRFEGWDAWAHLRPAEREAAQWLQNQARDGDNLIEADKWKHSDYSPFTRYTHVTGIPAVIGPRSHTFQWGQARKSEIAMWQEVNRRKLDIRRFYLTDDEPLRREILRRYGVRFVISGELERKEYGTITMQNLENVWPVQRVFGLSQDQHRVTILRGREP